ncbi:MAG: PKD domain-containing protein [Myxococcales bacterium]|nr:PKD domain-containing protein [Myxococcales bacterium]
MLPRTFDQGRYAAPRWRLDILVTLCLVAACGDGSSSTGQDQGPCIPTTCLEQHAACDDIVDGCGGVLDCGTCGPGETCGGAGTPNACGAAASSISLAVTPSRTAGVAPLAVFFDASATTGLDGDDYLLAHFTWDFGDANAGLWSTTNNSRNAATGYLVAHVFELPGTYQVSVAVLDRVGRVGAAATVSITVEDPQAVYADLNTRCVSQTGDFAAAPTGAELLTSSDLDAQLAWVNGASNRRLLFRRGEVWNDVIAHFTGTGPNTVGAFGAGERPRFVLAPDAEINRSVSVSGVDWRILDLELDGSLLPAHGTAGANGMGFSGTEVLGARIHVHDAGSTGFGAGGDYNYLYESVVEDNGYFSGYVDGVGMAIMGSRLDQLRIATSFLRPAESKDMYVANNLIDASREAPTCAIKWHSRRGVITDNVLTAGAGRFCSGESGDGWDHPVNLGLGVALLERNALMPSGNLANDQYNSTGFYIQNSHMVVRNNLLYEMSIAFQSEAADAPPSVDYAHILHNTVYLSAEAIGLNVGNGDLFSVSAQTLNWDVRNNLMYSLNGPGTTCNGSCLLARFASTAGLTFSNNIYHKPSMTNWFEVAGTQYTFADWQGLGMDADAQDADPLFVAVAPGDPSFLTLSAGSPAIDTGVCVATFSDYLGTVRPQGEGCDVGAFEYVP